MRSVGPIADFGDSQLIACFYPAKSLSPTCLSETLEGEDTFAGYKF